MKNLRLVFTIISFILTVNSLCQTNEKLKILLDTIKNIDYDITPNIAIKKNLIGSNIIWVGKIDTIEINTIKKKLQLIFYCTHFYFDTISKELICSKKMKLKKLGDGNFTCSIISESMTINDANNAVRKLYEKSSPYIFTIGKVECSENKFGKKYINIKSYNFYTFHL